MRFECVRCGNCCKQSGDLRLIDEDIKHISRYLGVTREQFVEKYSITNIKNKLFFINVHNFCPFLSKDNLCTIQSVKPFFCRNYIPFIDSPWAKIYEVCQGLGKGREWTDDEVKEIYNKLLNKLVIVEGGE